MIVSSFWCRLVNVAHPCPAQTSPAGAAIDLLGQNSSIGGRPSPGRAPPSQGGAPTHVANHDLGISAAWVRRYLFFPRRAGVAWQNSTSGLKLLLSGFFCRGIYAYIAAAMTEGAFYFGRTLTILKAVHNLGAAPLTVADTGTRDNFLAGTFRAYLFLVAQGCILPFVK